jgi:hypothetical protein
MWWVIFFGGIDGGRNLVADNYVHISFLSFFPTHFIDLELSSLLFYDLEKIFGASGHF